MKLIYKYSFNQFLSTNLSLFAVLFLIVSMIFFINIARLTSNISLSFLDFLYLYALLIPRILIFTLPVSFFIALALSLYRLSRENESIVCFALGFSPKFLAYFFLKIAFLYSAFMLCIALVFMPLADSLRQNFIDYKVRSDNVRLKVGEFGQKFGTWLVFIEKQNGLEYENITLFQPKDEKNKEQFITAKRAEILNEANELNFILNDGLIYHFEENLKLHIGHFDKLSFNLQFPSMNEPKGVGQYWSEAKTDKKRAKELVMYVLISLFPMASALFAMSFGLLTYRYEKGFIYLGIFAVIALYFGALSALYQNVILSIVGIFCTCFFASILYFRYKILSRY